MKRGDTGVLTRGRTKREWEEETLAPALQKAPERMPEFTTLSGMPLARLYTQEDLAGWEADEKLGLPGEYPFTRGPHPTMYRGRLWTMRQFSGFGTARDTNRRYRYLLDHGQTGLSVAFDMPTLMGLDSDDPRSLGEVGREGVAIDTLQDMETLFEAIPLSKVSTSMTINAPAAVLLAMYLAVARRQGARWDEIRGTIQNDILKEYIAQKEWIFPPRPSLRIIVDMIAFCTREVPLWNTVSISGYHIREAGSTAAQELAFTLADGIGYVQACTEAGLDVDTFAPRLSFFFNAHSDFFEEIAKYRAARRIWSRVMRDRFHAKSPRSWVLRTHAQTAGCSLTAQQPLNNIVRVALQALSAVLGGTQSLHTNSMDETLGLPTEEAVTIALRTQQILAEETGVPHTIDPLAGSYFVESLTDRIEKEALDLIDAIDRLGGIVPAIEQGFPQREIAEASFRYQQQLERGEKAMVGVNRYREGAHAPVEILKISPTVETRQIRSLKQVRKKRDRREHEAALEALLQAAQAGTNLMPAIVRAVEAYASVGEICGTLRAPFGEYREEKTYF
ncbi:MAG TPA: methylmalonyl-CoA mutase family protein [Candidatus Polarisedimenticolia bacterium]|nr:methylmalonyl-CoA mutase family protein [Candidatus Polarisedimenticolia bacterium]